MDKFRRLLLHAGAVFSFICITAKILDWYNPYMNFSGHIWLAQIGLCLAAIALEATA